jgi:hypothetical protein
MVRWCEEEGTMVLLVVAFIEANGRSAPTARMRYKLWSRGTRKGRLILYCSNAAVALVQHLDCWRGPNGCSWDEIHPRIPTVRTDPRVPVRS